LIAAHYPFIVFEMKSQFITISNFESLLGEVLLSRGHDYIENVVDLKVTSNDQYNQWQAKVHGSEIYRVVIQAELTTDVIRFNSCSCPFDGPICKHQVAVLYTIQMTDHKRQKKQKASTDKVSDLLSKLTFEELKEYVKARTEEDDELKKHLLSAFAVKTLKTVEDFKQFIDQVMRPLRRNHGFIHHREFINAVKPIEALVESARERLNARDFQLAINIYLATLEKLIPAFQTIDDSNGILSGIVDDIFLSLNLIKESGPPQSVVTDLVKYSIKLGTSTRLRGSDHAWQFAELAASLAGSEDEDQIKKMIVALKQEGKGNDFIEWYSAERAANTLLHYFFNNKSEKEVNDFIDQNLKFHSIRKIAISAAMRARNHEKTLILCKDGIEEAERAKHPGTVSELRRTMLTVYLLQKDKQNIVATAELLFLESHDDLTSYRILKEHMDKDEWAVKSAQYKQKLEKNYEYGALAEILKEENNPSQLLRILILSNNVELIGEYESAIPQELKSELQKIYFSIITASLESRVDRSNYRFNAQLLKKMLGKYDDVATIEFANVLRERYKQRKALLEEFSVIPLRANA
jgi:hypothetical protein